MLAKLRGEIRFIDEVVEGQTPLTTSLRTADYFFFGGDLRFACAKSEPATDLTVLLVFELLNSLPAFEASFLLVAMLVPCGLMVKADIYVTCRYGHRPALPTAF